MPVDQLLLGLEDAEQVEAAGFVPAEAAERRAVVAKRRSDRGVAGPPAADREPVEAETEGR